MPRTFRTVPTINGPVWTENPNSASVQILLKRHLENLEVCTIAEKGKHLLAPLSRERALDRAYHAAFL